MSRRAYVCACFREVWFIRAIHFIFLVPDILRINLGEQAGGYYSLCMDA